MASAEAATVEQAVLRRLRLSAYDLPTRDKIPVIRSLLDPIAGGMALDIGLGTGYTTYRVFGERATVCTDIDAANLRLYRDRVATVPGARRPLCVVAAATMLPFKAGAFRLVLTSEVLEHLEDDDGAAAELGRVLAPDGTAIVTVPYTGIGFTSFLELLGVKTVHDYPGPEFHFRAGYDERALASLLVPHGLRVVGHRFYFRLFTRLMTDVVSLAHIAYQRLVHRRRAWTWADVAGAEHGLAFRVYRVAFPVLWGISRLDRLLGRWRGFGLVASVRKADVSP